MKGIFIATAFLTLAASSLGAVTVNVNAKNGDIVTGEKKFRVIVYADDPVTQVEFYVGSELRDKDTSTPYEFAIDSLSETDGDLRVRFKAYTTEGESGETAVTVKIDNGLAKGADYHVKAGVEALQISDWDAAITSGRIALRADSKSNTARMVLARAYLGKKDTAQAQKYAEDIIDADPTNQEAKDLLAAINLQVAFRTYTSGSGNVTDSLATMGEAFKNAIESRLGVLNAAVEAAGAPEANLLKYSDAALKANRYAAALPLLRAAFDKDSAQVGVANRLAYVYLRQAKPQDAITVLNGLQRNGTPDAYSYALRAVALAEVGDVAGSDAAMQEAIVSDSENPAIVPAQAYIALKFVRYKAGGLTSLNLNYDDLSGSDAAARAESRQTLQKLTGQLAANRTGRSETFYYQEAMNNLLAQYGPAQTAFERAVLAEPAFPDAFIEMGNQALRSIMLSNVSAEDRTRALATAKTMYEAALVAHPTSAQALTGLTLTSVLGNKLDEAVRWGESAITANPDYAAGRVALATAYSLGSTALGQQAVAIRGAGGADAEQRARAAEAKAGEWSRSVRTQLSAAARLDKRLEGQELSKAPAAWRYYSAGGRVPVLPLPL